MSGELFFGLLLTAIFYGSWMAFIHCFMKDVDDRERDTDDEIGW